MQRQTEYFKLMKGPGSDKSKPKKLPGFGFRLPEPLIPAFREAFAQWAPIVKKEHGIEPGYTDFWVALSEDLILKMKAGTPPFWPPWLPTSKQDTAPAQPKRKRPKTST